MTAERQIERVFWQCASCVEVEIRDEFELGTGKGWVEVDVEVNGGGRAEVEVEVGTRLITGGHECAGSAAGRSQCCGALAESIVAPPAGALATPKRWEWRG